jgi:hypothetical protein
MRRQYYLQLINHRNKPVNNSEVPHANYEAAPYTALSNISLSFYEAKYLTM